MQTILFVDNGNPFSCGFRLGKHNFDNSPIGKIRIARFETSFSPDIGFGYYGDIYLRQFVRKWKNTVKNKRRKIEKIMTLLCFKKMDLNISNDILRYIVEFL